MTVEATREQLADMRTQAAPVEEASRKRRIAPRTLLVSGIALTAALVGAAWIMMLPSAESTDDAYVAADLTSVAPKVRGLVAAVLVRDNQHVRAGTPLVRIDPEEFGARAQSAGADLADARAQVASAQAALLSLDAEERLAAAHVTASRTAIRSATAEAEQSEGERRRYDALIEAGAVSQQEAEAHRTAAISAGQASARAQALLTVAEREGGVTTAKRALLQAALQKAAAVEARAKAALDLAHQDERHTLIRAAIDGVAGNRQVQVGDYVQPGSRLLTLVPLGAVYVTANFKETQTRRMREGQSVTISVDALDGPARKGRVESLAPGSGSTFALLPFEPGTGNFTKIVQPGIARLRPGLSVVARVNLTD